jgi:predicted 3-demethylubiquinone-9 3-methyltransferase (glyoxalase superfamily)
MPTIVPNLWFDTEAEQAAEFYVSVFPRSRVVSTARYTEAGPRPAGTVMTVQFELDGQPFIGIDGGPEFPFTEAVSFQITCQDQDEVDHYWTACARAAARARADGSRTGSGCRGRWCLPAWTSCSATLTRGARRARCRRCSACASSTSPLCGRRRTASR